MRVKRLMPFLEADGSQGGGATPPSNGNSNQTQQQTPSIDYERIAQILEGKQAATEESVLKGYFKQQGLSKEEMEQAITAFKQQKAANQPDVNLLQDQAAQAKKVAQQAQLESVATLAAVGLGIEAKTIPYLIKMTDLSEAIGQEGKINEEVVLNALKTTLENVPGLKPVSTSGSSGFIQVGASGSGQQQPAGDESLKKAFGL